MSVEKVELEITIDKKGDVSYTVKGLKGKECTKTTEFLDKALGEVTKRDYTHEYYQQSVRTTNKIRSRR